MTEQFASGSRLAVALGAVCLDATQTASVWNSLQRTHSARGRNAGPREHIVRCHWTHWLLAGGNLIRFSTIRHDTTPKASNSSRWIELSARKVLLPLIRYRIREMPYSTAQQRSRTRKTCSEENGVGWILKKERSDDSVEIVCLRYFDIILFRWSHFSILFFTQTHLCLCFEWPATVKSILLLLVCVCVGWVFRCSLLPLFDVDGRSSIRSSPLNDIVM